MNELLNCFESILFEEQTGIPRDLTLKALKVFEHSDTIKKLYGEYDEACRSGRKEIKQDTIDKAFEEVEGLQEILIEFENVSEVKKYELKTKNKANGQKVKKIFCDSLRHDDIRIM